MELLELQPEVQNFVVKWRVTNVFLYILTMKNTNPMLKFSLEPLEFHTSGIYGITGIWTRAVLNTFLLCKNKNAVLNLIYSLVFF